MKTKPLLLLLMSVFGAALTLRLSAAEAPHDVKVVYAFVPKERLAEAVKDKEAALHIEKEWKNEMTAKPDRPGYPLNLANQQYSIVAFVSIPARFALSGKIGIPVQNPKNLMEINVTLAPGYSGTYVSDGGGLILTRGIPDSPKPYEWLQVETK